MKTVKRKTAKGKTADVHCFGFPVPDGEVETTPPPSKVKVEPKSTAEELCKAAGVPTGMADKMIVATIS